jgi:hypothetical protein
MQAKEAAKMLGGSITIYVVMAACSAASGPGGFTSQDGSASGGSGSGSGGTIGASASSGSGSGSDGPSIFDALTDPVPEAKAASLPPIVATESCTGQYTSGGSTFVYAEHAFPGQTATQLAAVETLIMVPSSASVPPGYTQEQDVAYVRDGYAAVLCGVTSDPSVASMTVTFVLPQ